MPTVSCSESCVICGVHESVMHSHHTIPQARGGADSLQIILCSSCHNILHANATYIISSIRNPNRPKKSFWKTEDELRCADQWLKILVQALITPVPEEQSDGIEHLVGTKLSGSDFKLFKLLAADLGCSQEKAVEYCIKSVLNNRGFNNEKTKTELWFLRIPKA